MIQRLAQGRSWTGLICLRALQSALYQLKQVFARQEGGFLRESTQGTRRSGAGFEPVLSLCHLYQCFKLLAVACQHLEIPPARGSTTCLASLSERVSVPLNSTATNEKPPLATWGWAGLPQGHLLLTVAVFYSRLFSSQWGRVPSRAR